jgi:hypothetical protein
MTAPGGWPPFAHARRVAALRQCGELPWARASAAAAVRCCGKASGRHMVRRVPAGASRPLSAVSASFARWAACANGLALR